MGDGQVRTTPWAFPAYRSAPKDMERETATAVYAHGAARELARVADMGHAATATAAIA